jgi:DNA-binding Xre family transcriptional regulator
MPWPTCGTGKGANGFVLCGDLVRALKLESATAVALAWGVARNTVCTWRRILDVPRFNPGTHQLFSSYQARHLTPEIIARSNAERTPREYAKLAMKNRRQGHTRKRQWTAQEDILLGAMSDSAVAKRLGCSLGTVFYRRKELGIAPSVTAARASFLKRRDANLLHFSPMKLKARRLKLNLFQWQVAERCGWKSPESYQRLEAGDAKRAGKKALAKIAEALKCQLEDLLMAREKKRLYRIISGYDIKEHVS